MRKRKPTPERPPPEATRPPPTWTRMPPMPPSTFASANLDWAEREHRRDQYSLDQRAWEREQTQVRQAWERGQEQARQAQAREDELRRTLAQIAQVKAEALAARRVARRALARDRALTETNAKTLAALQAAQRKLAAIGDPKAAIKRGPKGYSVKEMILDEANRWRSAEKRVTATALLKWAKKNQKIFGNNSFPSIRTIRRWLSLKRP